LAPWRLGGKKSWDEETVSKSKAIWIATLLLLLCFALQVGSARLKAPTYDEQGHIARGYAYVKLGDLHIRIGTPILLNALNALPLLTLPDVRLPVDSPSWSGTDFHPISERFMWHVNPNADQILFLARLPTTYLTLLLCVFVYRWARELFGPRPTSTWAGLLALGLCALDPNVIAHGRLATTDLGSAALMYIATYWAWRFLRVPSWRHLALTGVMVGLAQASKFSALAHLPILGLIFLLRAFTSPPFALSLPWYSGLGSTPGMEHRTSPQRWLDKLGWLLLSGALIGVVAFLTLWGVYGFQVAPLPGVTNRLAPAWPVPAAAHFDQLLDLSGRLVGEEERLPTSFLLGELYPGGRWEYFPVAFLVKTPIPTLVFLAGAVVLIVGQAAQSGLPNPRRGRVRGVQAALGPVGWALWLPPLVFIAISLRSNLNLGYRYLLPALPYLYVLAGRMGQWIADGLAALTGPRRALLAAATAALIGWSAWSGLAIYPHYLAYFNEWAGGPDEGWRILVDSNLDWGQDLKGLKRWMDGNGVERVKLGYVGEAYPAYYGIEFDPLPSWPDRWQHPLYHDLYPPDPAPGVYAISANLIQGRNLVDPQTYAWFRAREPVDKVGYSIFIYDVPAHGSGRAVLALSGVDLADLRPEDYARLGTNDVRVLWFDARRAIPAPGGQTTPGGEAAAWLSLADETPVHPALQGLLPVEEAHGAPCLPSKTRSGRSFCMWTDNPQGRMAAHVETLAPNAPAWHLPAARFTPGDPADHGERLAYPVRFGDVLELLAYEVHPGSAGETALRPGETLTVVTYWQVREPVEDPLKLFVHLLDAESAYRGGEDRLDVWYDNWQAGDRFAQVQEVPLDATAGPGVYQVEIGWYDPETMQRLPVLREGAVIADRVLLAPVRVE
jgi:hypothetical protein